MPGPIRARSTWRTAASVAKPKFAANCSRWAGVDLVGVPYRGQPEALTNLLGGQVQVTFDPLANSIGHVRAGRLRALAVTTAMRSPELPDVPAIGEFVPGYEASGWQGIGAPRDTPPEVIDILNKEINTGLADTKMKARFADAGGYTPFQARPPN